MYLFVTIGMLRLFQSQDQKLLLNSCYKYEKTEATTRTALRNSNGISSTTQKHLTLSILSTL